MVQLQGYDMLVQGSKKSKAAKEKIDHDDLRVLFRFVSLLCENSIVCSNILVRSELFNEITRILVSAQDYLPSSKKPKDRKDKTQTKKALMFICVSKLFLSIVEVDQQPNEIVTQAVKVYGGLEPSEEEGFVDESFSSDDLRRVHEQYSQRKIHVSIPPR